MKSHEGSYEGTGGEDRTIAPQASERIFNGAVRADKTLKIFPGLRHEILNEPERQ